MSALRSFAAPFIVFMAMLALISVVESPKAHEFYLAKPQYWIFPLQTAVCGALLLAFRRDYRLRFPSGLPLTLGIAALVFVLWVSPQAFFHAAPRTEGFDPTVFAPGSALYWGTLALRFLRLVVVVPFVEEIFWRGFLMRYIIQEDFEAVPVGAFSWNAFLGVVFCMGSVHWGSSTWIPGQDFVPALATSALFNWVAMRTQNISSCVLAHAVTNLLLGIYIMETKQWGFW